MVAGVPLRDENVLQLVRLLYDAGFDSTAKALVAGLRPGRPSITLSVLDRQTILLALDDPPQVLSELRGTLLAEHVKRNSELAQGTLSDDYESNTSGCR